MPLDVGHEIVALDTLEALLAACYVAPQRVVAPEHFIKDHIGYVAGRIVSRADLFKNNLALLCDLFRHEARAAKHIGYHFQGRIHVVVWNQSAIVSMLVVGGRVHITAHALNRLGNLHRIGSLFGPFENHVLYKVADTAYARVFVPRANAQVELHSRRPCMGHSCCYNAQAVGQGYLFVYSLIFGCR